MAMIADFQELECSVAERDRKTLKAAYVNAMKMLLTHSAVSTASHSFWL